MIMKIIANIVLLLNVGFLTILSYIIMSENYDDDEKTIIKVLLLIGKKVYDAFCNTIVLSLALIGFGVMVSNVNFDLSKVDYYSLGTLMKATLTLLEVITIFKCYCGSNIYIFDLTSYFFILLVINLIPSKNIFIAVSVAFMAIGIICKIIAKCIDSQGTSKYNFKE